MSSFCTCGAELPPQARFCHKCGKPQGDLTEPEEAGPQTSALPVAPRPAAAVKAEPKEINFHNSLAVRIALLIALLRTLFSSLPIPPQGFWLLISLMGGGYLAVLLYKRRSGDKLTPTAGARMGWITGIFSFVIAMVLLTVSMLLITSRGGFSAFFREQLQERMGQSPEIDRVLEVLQNPAGLATVLAVTLGMLFILFAVFSILGGVLGAKFSRRERA